jgi:hypothetical protein
MRISSRGTLPSYPHQRTRDRSAPLPASVAGRLLRQGRVLGGLFSHFEPNELIDHDANGQQHQQCHDDGRTHSLIILLGWRADCCR